MLANWAGTTHLWPSDELNVNILDDIDCRDSCIACHIHNVTGHSAFIIPLEVLLTTVVLYDAKAMIG